MSGLEIILLLAGCGIFIGSFLVPVKKEELQEQTKKLAKDEVKAIVAGEMEQAKHRMSEMSVEACQEQLQKTERSMERISNEKIMAVNEYSDTVLEEIHKNHQEVVFLYDMLNDKQDTMKTVISDADKSLRDLLQQVKDSEISIREKLDSKKEEVHLEEVDSPPESVPSKEQIEESKPEFKPFMPKKVDVVPKRTRKTQTPTKKKEEETTPAIPKTEQRSDGKRDSGELQLQFSSPKKDNGINSNERILQLHKAGKSNMAIAKELGLGIGEVKLVIDLYEGMR